MREYNRRHYCEIRDRESYKARVRAYGKRWHEENRVEENRKEAEAARKLRQKCLDAYGGVCACCGEARYEFLAIDHINGGGGRHRREIGNKICRWLESNGFPQGFRVLCHNCNQSLGHYGYCPHQREKRTGEE